MIKYAVTTALTLAIAATGIYVAGCETKGQTGALIGTGVGAGVGALAGRSAASTLIGGAVGGGAGYIVGNEGDKKDQRREMEQIQAQANSEVINIHNSNSSISQVRVTRSGTGWAGPRGEWYDHVPTEAELRPIYGF